MDGLSVGSFNLAFFFNGVAWGLKSKEAFVEFSLGFCSCILGFASGLF